MLALVLGAHAGTLFSTGPDILNSSVPSISGNYQVGDLFTLTAPASVAQISFSEWVPTGTTPLIVTWGFKDLASIGHGGGAAAISSATLTASNVSGYDVYWSSINISSFLFAGDYWLWLSNASPASGWGLASTSGSAQQFDSSSGSFTPLNETQSFALYDSGGPGPGPGGAPEPSSLLLVGTGLAGVVARIRKVISK
jgi:hypothetical protein